MKRFFTVPVKMEADSQQQAENKVNQLMDATVIRQPSILQLLCIAGLTYLKGRYDDKEKEDQKDLKDRLAKAEIAMQELTYLKKKQRKIRR